MIPDYDRAATAAMELLISEKTSETPIDALSMLLKQRGVRVISFSRMAAEAETDREELVPLFGSSNRDAATFHLNMDIENVEYVVVYNRFLTMDVVMRGIARELGHIVLGHDGQTRSTEVRMAEALCFAHHLLSPRPIIHMLQESGSPFTQNVLSDVTGCSGECVEGLRQIPGAHVSAKLNREIRAQFERGITEYIQYHSARPDNSPLLDLGSFMDYYKE